MRQHLHEFSMITSSLSHTDLPSRASTLRNSKMNGTSFQARWGRVKNLYRPRYVASIVKRYKGRGGDEVRRHASRVERDEGRNKDGDGRTVECRVSVQTHLTLPFLFVSVALLTLGPFSRAYTSMSLRAPSRDMRHSYAGWWKSAKWKRAASMTRSLMRQKGLLFERIIIFLRYVMRQFPFLYRY